MKRKVSGLYEPCHNTVAIVCKKGGRSRSTHIHENELNGKTVLGHVPVTIDRIARLEIVVKQV